MSRLANWFLNRAEWAAKISSSEPAIILSEHSITIKYEKPDSNFRRVWDTSMYKRGNIFRSKHANAIKVNVNQEDLDLVASDRYKHFMNLKIIKDAFISKGERNEMIRYLLFGLIGLNVIMMIILVVGLQS